MKTAALAVVAAVLLTGCGGDEPLSPAASASASCSEVAELLERPSLRMADVAKLGKAQSAAEAAAEGEPRWADLAASMTRLRAAATDVADSVQRPTSGTEQQAINAAYSSAKGVAAQACSGV